MESCSQNPEFRNDSEMFTNVTVYICTGLSECLCFYIHMTYPVFMMQLKYKVTLTRICQLIL